MKNTYLIAALLISCTTSTFAQYKGLDVVKVANSQQPYINENIHIPDIEGYKTLKCDFHTHTIFSDGTIMPEERVWEGNRRGLDAIAITHRIPSTQFIHQSRSQRIIQNSQRSREKCQYNSDTGSGNNQKQTSWTPQCTISEGCQCFGYRRSADCHRQCFRTRSLHHVESPRMAQ